MDEIRVRGLIVEAFRTLSKTASNREEYYAYESGYDIARKSLAELVDTVNEAVTALENPEAMPEYLRGDGDAYSVSMTCREYRVVLAALYAVCDDGERRTRLNDGDKSSTLEFGEVAKALMARNGNPWDED